VWPAARSHSGWPNRSSEAAESKSEAKGDAKPKTDGKDGKTAAVAQYDKVIRLVNLDTGKEIRRFTDQPARHALFDPTGLKIAANSTVWDLATGKEIRKIPGYTTVKFSSDGKLLAAAETLERARVPLIYRVHDEPDGERVNALREVLQGLDVSLPKGGVLQTAQFNQILARVRGRDVEKLVNEVVLRTQAQAEYAAENYGHFGLQLRRYVVFSPPHQSVS
jgi:hypothetical protein